VYDVYCVNTCRPGRGILWLPPTAFLVLLYIVSIISTAAWLHLKYLSIYLSILDQQVRLSVYEMYDNYLVSFLLAFSLVIIIIMLLGQGALSDDARLTSVCRVQQA